MRAPVSPQDPVPQPESRAGRATEREAFPARQREQLAAVAREQVVHLLSARLPEGVNTIRPPRPTGPGMSRGGRSGR